MKEACKKCASWTGVGHQRYKCYTNKCPAKKRDDATMSKERKKSSWVYEIGWEDEGDDNDHVVWIQSTMPITFISGRGKNGICPITGIYIRKIEVPSGSGGVDFEVKIK